MSRTVTSDLLMIALPRASGGDFERFANAFFASILGEKFIPLGGVADGGADAALEGVFSYGSESTEYFQASIQDDFRSKIRGTIRRLREVGRTPSSLYYVTPHRIALLDQEEATLSKESGVHVRMRDETYLSAHLNDSPGTIQAFHTHLAPYTEFLKQVGSGMKVDVPAGVKSPEVFVFLRQELDRRGSSEPMNIAIADSLIVWALEGTDPDKGIFRTPEEILNRVESILPGAANELEKTIRRRLEVLSSKVDLGTARIRHYRKEDKYCLPIEQRERLEQENLEDSALREKVLSQFDLRIQLFARSKNNSTLSTAKAAAVSLKCVEMAFEKLGLEFAAFLSGDREIEGRPKISEYIDPLVREAFKPAEFEIAADSISSCLRDAVYSSTDDERNYFDRLCRTYALLLSLKTDLKIASYFQELAARLRLLVGSDIIVQALSERYVDRSSQVTRNTLLVAREYGANLVLTEPAVDEVLSHIRAVDLEYKNHYAEIDQYMTPEIAFQSNRLLIRAYYRAKFGTCTHKPASWTNFLYQFCNPAELHKPIARDQIKTYLVQHFGFSFMQESELLSCVNEKQFEDLTNKLIPTKKDQDRRLARNDALAVLGVYGLRRQAGENGGKSALGYATWWLTEEYHVVGQTKEIVSAHGSRYMMRPDFLLNFISLSPSAAKIRKTYANIFPSTVGLMLGRRVKPEIFLGVLDKLKELQGLEHARVMARVAELSDKLKSDLRRNYETSLSSPRDPQ